MKRSGRANVVDRTPSAHNANSEVAGEQQQQNVEGGAGDGASKDAQDSGTKADASDSKARTGSASQPPPSVAPGGEKDAGGGERNARVGEKDASGGEKDTNGGEKDGSAKTPQDQANEATPAIPPVSRLETLKTPESAHSGTPAARRGGPSARGAASTRGARGGASARGKKAVPQPTFRGRRNREEREKLEQEQRDRDKQRLEERRAEERKQRSGFGGEKDKKGRQNATRLGRGGFSAADPNGPFSWGAPKKQKREHSHFSSGSGGVRIKNEPGEDGDYKSLGISIKKEDGGYISSEDDDDIKFPRRNIDFIEVSSDEQERAPSKQKPKRGKSSTAHSLMPVRVSRKDHHDRVLGKTESSSSVPTKSPEQAEESKDSLKAIAAESATRKGKMKDVEITDVRKPYKGMWQDADEPQGSSIKIEVISDEENSSEAVDVRADTTAKAAEKRSVESPATEKKPPVKGGYAGIAPALQTDEDRAEWERYQAKLRFMRLELGSPEPQPVREVEENNPDEVKDVRHNNVYIFQLPPDMPALLSPKTKAAEASDASEPAPPAPSGTDHNVLKPQVEIKLEDEAPEQSTKVPRFPSTGGYVGKMRVHKSGKTTLDWGGSPFVVMPGLKARFLQEVISLDITPEADRVSPDDGGKARSFGRVKGKFVVTPDWDGHIG
ncbi:RNA polymerase III RPC4-domain-containing protein [Clohesyomyces aquaticus]|uniref:RNA polymerase III RPC4-domain-containing protein n=1 Tax=Clohesyomyces aquaticus TaxID=1231657 RepID=A0A1Y2A4A0_9PLEO|nr:RNA polymerase III RPC4-domain-containing protein [Clohesyomyces aquaticus]